MIPGCTGDREGTSSSLGMLDFLKRLVFVMAAGVLCTAADAPAGAAARLFEAGEIAARAGDTLQSYLYFARAAQLAPANAAYRQRKLALQSAEPLARPAQVEPLAAAAQGPGQAPAVEAESFPLEAASPARLAPTPGKHSFDIRGEARSLCEQVAQAYGVQIVFDDAYQSLMGLRFRVEDATFEDALRILEATTDSFVVPVNEHSALVARDTQQKRTELTPVMVVAIPIPERISVQEGQEMATAVQQTLEIRRVSLDATRRLVIFRDTVFKLTAAQQMFNNLARLRAQIAVDVEFVSMGKTSSLSYGLSLPTSSSIINFGHVLNSVPQAAGAFFRFGGGTSLLGLGIANAAAFATLSKSSTETILQAQIVALDGQAASLHVGNRYPIITGSFSGVTPGAANAQSLAPSVRFEDLGLVLKITPVVHGDNEVTLDVEAEFKTLGSGSANGIPVIATRSYHGKVRLQDGEWAVLAGLMSRSDAETQTGVAGLSSIPGLGRAFTKTIHDQDMSETLLIFKPHLVSLPPWETETLPLRTGSETRLPTTF